MSFLNDLFAGMSAASSNPYARTGMGVVSTAANLFTGNIPGAALSALSTVNDASGGELLPEEAALAIDAASAVTDLTGVGAAVKGTKMAATVAKTGDKVAKTLDKTGKVAKGLTKASDAMNATAAVGQVGNALMNPQAPQPAPKPGMPPQPGMDMNQLMAAQMQDPTMGMMQPPGQGGPGGPGGGMPLSNFSQFMSPQTNSPMQQMAKTPGAGYFGGYYG